MRFVRPTVPVGGGRSPLALTWLTFRQACSLIALPIFHGCSTDLESWTVGLAEAPSTTVDPAEMREFICSGEQTYRPDHGASRGASSL